MPYNLKNFAVRSKVFRVFLDSVIFGEQFFNSSLIFPFRQIPIYIITIQPNSRLIQFPDSQIPTGLISVWSNCQIVKYSQVYNLFQSAQSSLILSHLIPANFFQKYCNNLSCSKKSSTFWLLISSLKWLQLYIFGFIKNNNSSSTWLFKIISHTQITF